MNYRWSKTSGDEDEWWDYYNDKDELVGSIIQALTEIAFTSRIKHKGITVKTGYHDSIEHAKRWIEKQSAKNAKTSS